ncbi:MAG: endonuclease/exonuclease/phosphatase family protein [Clostridia bacterium]|nr:endonuclease/exonuclease/phosphatase family protein [Clostridia bacterium]
MLLKTVSFNIRCCDDPDGHSVAERAPRLEKVISQIGPDLIGIQEFTPIWEDHFKRIFDAEYEMLNKYRSQTGWIEGSPLLWRRGKFTATGRGWFWYSDTPDVESGGWDVTGHKRICTYVRLKSADGGREFVFMNTHFGFGDEGQVKSAELIKARTRAFADTPFFITGDFNAAPDSKAYAVLTSFMKDANGSDLDSVTYHGYRPGSPENAHIDYCFCGPGVTPLDARIIDDSFDGKFPSDHYGLYTVLEIE